MQIMYNVYTMLCRVQFNYYDRNWRFMASDTRHDKWHVMARDKYVHLGISFPKICLNQDTAFMYFVNLVSNLTHCLS